MSTKHTPGPWGFHKMSGDSGYITECGSFDAHTIHVSAGEMLLCSVEAYVHKGAEYDGYPHTADFEENKANARLIAAAPELLEALEWISENGPDDAWELRERARAAVAKATGSAS